MQLLHSGDSEECSICLEILQDPVITRLFFFEIFFEQKLFTFCLYMALMMI